MAADRDDDEFEYPWLAIIVGVALLFFSWYLVSKMGTSPNLHGKASVVNSGLGRKLVALLMAIVGGGLLFRGFSAIRSK